MKTRLYFKLTVFILITVMLLGACPYVFAAVRSAENDKLIEYTPQIVDDVFRYLDEIYVEKYPEDALTPDFGSDKDKSELKSLADAVSYGHQTDREKADALYHWIRRNITYSLYDYAYPIDVYKDREGDCTGVAYLMQDVLRLMGIPAVVSSGWTQNMEAVTADELFEKDETDCYVYAGHAWVFVRLDGEWVLYDTLWGRMGVSDRRFIAENFYITNVGRVTPAYRYPELPHVYLDSMYTGESFYNVNVDTGEIYTDGTTPVQILNMHMIFTSYYHYSEEKVNRWYPVRDPDTKTNFKLSENYRGGWFYRIYEPGGYVGVLKSQYKSFVNIGNNSIIIPNRIVTMGERVFYQGSGEALDITPLSVEPSTRFGRLSIPVGYEGGIVNSVYDSAYSRENYTFEWTSSNESVLKVDENGNVRAVGVGFADIELTVSRKPVDGLEGGTLGGEHIQIYVYDTHEAINTSDAFEVEHTHEYVEIQRDADCELGGASIFVCSHPDCADYYEVSATPALGHSFGEYVSNKDATSTLDGTKTAVCTKCSKKDTVCDENSRGTNLEENVEDKGILKTDKTQMEQYVGGLVNGDIAQIQAPSHSGVEIPTSALEGMLDKSCTVTIEIGDIEAFIYPETLGGILESVNGETVTFHIKNTGTSSLNEKQLSAIEGAETAGIISAEIYSNGEYIHSFGVNNKIDLRIPFFNTSAQNSSEYKVYYLDEEGKISPVWCMWEDIEGGVMTFSTDHFSTYIIAKGVKEESPANDSIIPVICGVCGGVVVVAGVILIVSVKKRRKAQR